VTAGTCRLDVCTGQFEGGPIIVIEGCRQPGAGLMAGPAIIAELSVMLIVLLMTAAARSVSTLVNFILMTICACGLHVLACQFEGSQVMVESCRQPAIGKVTCTALCAKPGRVWIAFRMATSAIRGRSFEDAIYMTI
jgi:hypothetical protein